MTGGRSDGTDGPDILEIRARPQIIIGGLMVLGGIALLCLPIFRSRLDAGEVAGAAFCIAVGAVAIAVAFRLRYISIDDHSLTYLPAGASILFEDVARMLPPIFESIERQRDIRLEMKQAGLRWYPLRYHSLGKTLHISLFGVDKAALYCALETRLGKASE